MTVKATHNEITVPVFINPLTDFGFKKLFSTKLNFSYIQLVNFNKEAHELENNFDRWMYSLRYMGKLSEKPAEVQGRIFERLFKLAQIKRLTKKDMETYHKSILEYDDIKEGMALLAHREAKHLAKPMAKQMAKQLAERLAKRQAKQMAEPLAKQMAEQIADSKAQQMAYQTLELFIINGTKNGATIQFLSNVTQYPEKQIREILKKNGLADNESN